MITSISRFSSLPWTLVGLAAALMISTPYARASDPSLAQKVEALIAAYPEALSKAEDGKLTFKDGGPALAIDEGQTKDHAQRINSGDIEDSLQQIYPAGACETRPERNFDPGRIRSEALMKRLYGSTAADVQEDLVPVDWFGETLPVTRRNGVNAALESVRRELAKRPDLTPYLIPSAGTFNWRTVSGQPNLSVHSFGAAIDLNTAYADYWLWSGGKLGDVPKYANKFPMEIVDIFERHGFIWGGRWYHYDTMHFEYRPELLKIAEIAGVTACSAK